MRAAAGIGLILVATIGGASFSLGGCLVNIPIDCKNALVDCPLDGTGVGTPPECIPSDNVEPVDDSCGVFVSISKGKDSGDGTKDSPLKTLQQAIDKAKGQPIY